MLWTKARTNLLRPEHGDCCEVFGKDPDQVLCCTVKVDEVFHGICLPKKTLQLTGIEHTSTGGFQVSYTEDENGDVVVVDLLSETCEEPGTSFCSEFVRGIFAKYSA